MSEDAQILAESHTAESANAAAIAKEAELKAQAAQMAVLIQNGLEEFFQRGIDGKRFIPLNDRKMADAERFGFICDDITELKSDVSSIHNTLETWDENRVTKEDFQLVRNIVFGFIAVILLGVIGVLGTVMVIVLSSHPIA
jgi:hypothetical protein